MANVLNYVGLIVITFPIKLQLLLFSYFFPFGSIVYRALVSN